MSSVTRLHLLSQSMLNVSCQKQKRCSSLHTDSLTESPMESVGQPRPSGACNLLGVPGLGNWDPDMDDDEGEMVIGIRPKSSPLPRRRTSLSDEDSEPEPPLCGSRRVSFADAKGLSLVQVKEFDTWDVPKLPGYDMSESEGEDTEEYFLSPLTFSRPLPTEDLFVKVREQKVELETIELLPGTTILKGVLRVLNISFQKAVYIRTTLDTWSNHFDLLAEYIPGSSDSLTDCFSFRLTLVPPFGEQGARVDFCLRYETPVGTFWANNNNRNYILFCHQRTKERKEKQQRGDVNKKSCLKTVSQNVSTVEIISAMEASSQEKESTDVSKHREKEDTVKPRGRSEEDRQKLQEESRRNCSRRNRRRAARMARVRDLFAQRGEGANDAERDESPPESKQAAQERSPEEKRSDVQSFSEGKPDGSLVSESLEPIHDVLHVSSPAHDYTSNSEPEKSESASLADSATLRGGESDIPDNPLHSNDDPAPAEHQSINKSLSEAEESSQEQGTSPEYPSNTVAEPADSVIPAVSSESLVSQTSSFTFGTVVAPLYHQVFCRGGSESQSVGDWGNPARAALNVGDLTQSYPQTERGETSCTVPTDVNSKDEKVQENVIKTQEESKQDCLHGTLNHRPTEKEDETSPSMTTNDILDHSDKLQDSDQRCKNTSEVPETIKGNTGIQLQAVNILNTNLLNPQIPSENLHLQGETQEDNLTHDPQSQTAAETAQATQIKTNLDETLAQSEAEEAITSLETSFISLEPSRRVPERVSDETDQQSSSSGSEDCKCVYESHKDNDVANTATISTNSSISEEDKVDTLHDLDPNHINNSASKETEDSCVPCLEMEETAPQIVLETQEETNNVEEENKKPVMSNYHIHGDMFMELKGDDEIIASEKIEHDEMEASVSKQDDFCLADTAEVKNWEMMVEEEEKNIITDEDGGEAVSSKDTEVVEKDQGEQLEDVRIETASEKRDTTVKEKAEDKMVGEITDARQEDNKNEGADALEDKLGIGGEQIAEIVTELEYVQATKLEKAAREEDLAKVERREEQEETELKQEKHFAEMQEVTIERINIQEEEEIEEEEGEMEIHLNDHDEAGMEWEDQVKPREENAEGENPDYKEGILVDETELSEIVDTKSESMTDEDRENEVRCFEKSLDISQNKVEDGLFAPVTNVQDKRVTDKENTGERQNEHMPTEMHLYKDEGFQIYENVTQDLSEAARDESESTAAEEGSCFFTDELESDQLSDGSASDSESNSDDEVELYMHCLRVVHGGGAQAHKDKSKDTGFNVGKRPSISKSKLLSTPMPSITESLDEEQHLSPLQDQRDDDMETAVFQPTDAALQESSCQESTNRNVSWWTEKFSCRNIAKTLLFATMFVVFVVVAYHYDFLACFGLYLMSVIWLCCQGERQTVKNKNKIG